MENYLVGARFLTSNIDFPDLVMCFYFCFLLKPNLKTSNQVQRIRLQLQSNLSTTVALGTEESGRCGEVAVTGK